MNGFEGKKKAMAVKAQSDEEQKRIAELLAAFDAIVAPIEHELESVYRDEAVSVAEGFDVIDRLNLSVIDEAAEEFARDRAAELVGRKWVDGELVENDNARWAITDTTRDKLRELVDRAFTEGWTPAELDQEIEATGIFSSERAKLIAKTEMARAQVEGAMATAKEVGVIGKATSLSADHEIEDECDDAEQDGVIALEKEFSNGLMNPPFHPRCRCAISFYTASDEQAQHLLPELQEA